ncbi:MAG: GGDEF domain-containing response regulator [Candidatus Nanopelagicales bacterium]
MTTETFPRPLVVIVDDDPDLVGLLAYALSSWADSVSTTDSSQAVALCRTNQPDLILLDVQMPGLDGFDVINELKHDTTLRHIPVIFITAETFPEVESECLEAGAADYIGKPVNPRVLTARARTHVLLKQQADLLGELALRDQLTGTMSHRAFADRLRGECARAARTHSALSLVLVDIGELAAYNRTYGHVAGDDLLRAVASQVTAAVDQSTDVVARHGGGQFAVLLPDTGAARAAALAERIAAAVAQLGIRHAGAPGGQIRARLGVAELDRGAAPPAAWAAWLLDAAAKSLSGSGRQGGGSRPA